MRVEELQVDGLERGDAGQAVLQVVVDALHLTYPRSATNALSQGSRSGPRSARSHASLTTALR